MMRMRRISKTRDLLRLAMRPQGVTVAEANERLGLGSRSCLGQLLRYALAWGWDVRGFPLGEDRTGRKGRQLVAYRVVGRRSASGRYRARPASDK